MSVGQSPSPPVRVRRACTRRTAAPAANATASRPARTTPSPPTPPPRPHPRSTGRAAPGCPWSSRLAPRRGGSEGSSGPAVGGMRHGHVRLLPAAVGQDRRVDVRLAAAAASRSRCCRRRCGWPARCAARCAIPARHGRLDGRGHRVIGPRRARDLSHQPRPALAFAFAAFTAAFGGASSEILSKMCRDRLHRRVVIGVLLVAPDVHGVAVHVVPAGLTRQVHGPSLLRKPLPRRRNAAGSYARAACRLRRRAHLRPHRLIVHQVAQVPAPLVVVLDQEPGLPVLARTPGTPRSPTRPPGSPGPRTPAPAGSYLHRLNFPAGSSGATPMSKSTPRVEVPHVRRPRGVPRPAGPSTPSAASNPRRRNGSPPAGCGPGTGTASAPRTEVPQVGRAARPARRSPVSRRGRPGSSRRSSCTQFGSTVTFGLYLLHHVDQRLGRDRHQVGDRRSGTRRCPGTPAAGATASPHGRS